MTESSVPEYENECLTRLERCLDNAPWAEGFGRSVARRVERWGGRVDPGTQKGVVGAAFEVLQRMKATAAAGINEFATFREAHAYLVIRTARLLLDEGAPREVADHDEVAGRAETSDRPAEEPASWQRDCSRDALEYALRSCIYGTPLTQIAVELGTHFDLSISAERLAVQLAMAFRYFIGEDPESSVAKRLRYFRGLARGQLEPHLEAYFRSSGMDDRNVRIVVGLGLGDSDTDTAPLLGVTPSAIRARRRRLRAGNEAVRNTFPRHRIRPDLN